MKLKICIFMVALCLCACGNDAITDSQTEGTESEKIQNTESELDTSQSVIPEPGVPDEELTLMQKVLFGKVDYYGRTGVHNNNQGWHKITDLECFDYAYEYNEFGVCDLDGDGSQEVYLYHAGGDVIILHEEDGTVYGYLDVFRGFNNLCTNGIFVASSGASDNYWCGNISFDKETMRHDYIHVYDEYNPNRTIYAKGIAIYDESGWRYENEVEITEAEWEQICAQNPRGDRVIVRRFSVENVLNYVK